MTVQTNTRDDQNDEAQQEPDAEQDYPQTIFSNVNEFFEEYFRPSYKRAINGNNRVWAHDWWRYREAVIRLDALWRSWELTRQDPDGMLAWYREADYHMAALTSPDGPFVGPKANNAENKCRPGELLPHTPPPKGLFEGI